MKKTYAPINVEFNVNGVVVTANVRSIDPNLPNIESMDKFLGVKSPFGVDVQIGRLGNKVAINFVEEKPPVLNGIYRNNAEALAFADLARKTTDFYNALLVNKEYRTMPAYKVRFSPNGKDYLFRSISDSIKVGQTVVCRSIGGDQYAVVKDIIQISEEDWLTRAYCKLA